MRDTLLFAGVVGILGGILCRSFYFYGWYELLLALLIAGICLCAYWFHGVRVYLVISVVLIGFTCGSVRMGVATPSLPYALASQVGDVVSLTGTVAALPDLRETTDRITVAVPVDGESVKVLVVAPRWSSLSYGDQVSVSGTLELPAAFDTVGGRTFDYPNFLAKDGIVAMVTHAHVVQRGEPVALPAYPFRVLYGAREYFVRGVARALPEPAASLGVGMLVGGKQGLGEVLIQAFIISGLLPIVVLSGYNVMIVAQILLRVLRPLPRTIAIGSAMLAIILFVLASGAGASAVRAGLMAVIGLYAQISGRTYNALRVLVAVGVVMVVINPYLLAYDPGFQFSFIATVGLILGSPIVTRYLTWISSTTLREVVASTIAAQVFVLPLLLYHTGLLSLVALPANVLVLPLVPLAMLATVVAAVAGLVAPVLAPFVGLPAYALLSFVIWVATMTSSLPVASYTVAQFPFLFVVCAYAVLAVAVYRLTQNSSRTHSA